jgi:branched-chain amino acid transport system substrate-binding protein
MKRWNLSVAAGMAASIAVSAAGAQELRIGFLTNSTGSGGQQGLHQRNGWELGLEHEGWRKNGDKLGGVPMRLVYGDDQAKPDAGLKEIDKMLSVEKVHMVAGYMWSNVLMASRQRMVDARRIFMSTIPGASPLAGTECTPLFVNLAQNNDLNAEALGQLATADRIKSVYVLVPNYQGGKDIASGFRTGYRGGTIIGQSAFKLGEADFQADISKARAAKPEAVVFFGPGAMGISFVKQWAAAGAGKDIKLYTVLTIDWLTLPPMGDAALGAVIAGFWDPESRDAINQRFVKDYIAKHNHMPSRSAATNYDAARLVAAAVRRIGGKVDDIPAFAKALRHTESPSVRGRIAFSENGFLIETYYKLVVEKAADGKPAIVNRGLIFKDRKDPFWKDCPADRRL